MLISQFIQSILVSSLFIPKLYLHPGRIPSPEYQMNHSFFSCLTHVSNGIHHQTLLHLQSFPLQLMETPYSNCLPQNLHHSFLSHVSVFGTSCGLYLENTKNPAVS